MKSDGEKTKMLKSENLLKTCTDARCAHLSCCFKAMDDDDDDDYDDAPPLWNSSV